MEHLKRRTDAYVPRYSFFTSSPLPIILTILYRSQTVNPPNVRFKRLRSGKGLPSSEDVINAGVRLLPTTVAKTLGRGIR